MKKLILLLILFSFGISYSQNSSNMRLLSNLSQHGSSGYSACWGYVSEDGKEYAFLGCYNGTAIIDITDTLNIREVDFIPGLNSSWREMKAYNGHLYIVSEANGSGLQIVNLKYLPDSASLVRTFTMSGYTRTHTISQLGPYLYMNGGDYLNDGIFVLDITNAGYPVLKGTWESEYVHDSRIANDTIWAANIYSGYISVIDATNKDSLRTITRWLNLPSPGPHNCDLTEDRKFILVTDEINGDPRLLKIWDVEDLTDITFVTSWQPPGITTSIVHNVEVYGNYAVIAHYTAGVRIVDISNPAAPTEIAWYDTYPANNGFSYSGCWGVYMFPSGKIVASDMQTGMYVLKSNAIITGKQNEQLPSEFKLKQNYPNPFNPGTMIEFSLPKSGYVTLKVFDVLGKEVKTLMNGYTQAGNHKIYFNGNGLSSGIYFYTLNSESFRNTKQMILVK